ncbi:hypothetical protein WJX81_004523 [Elliptochloris bilobata]|uniref:Uncharacterized protein n=1 Tax=Elliptochloris bilobata TaxID=381761 RepID=A0AAW1RMD7_9CHLO
MKFGTLRYPGGEKSDSFINKPLDFDAFMGVVAATGAEPYLVKHFEFSNESNKVAYGYATAAQYTAALLDWAPRLKAIMPDLLLGANGPMGCHMSSDVPADQGVCWWEQKDLHDMERALEVWCPEEHRPRLRFAVTESAAIDWGDICARWITAAQDDNSWTPNGTAISILGTFFRGGQLIRDFWSKPLRAWAIRVSNYSGNACDGQLWAWQAHKGHEGEPHEDRDPSWGVTGSGLCLGEDGALELVLPPVSISVIAF